jgi:hypothetical protein
MTELNHVSIESNLPISPEDVIVLPEIYGFVMEQIKSLPCGKVVLTQSYDYIFDTLNPGQTWSQLGFLKCITTSEKQKEHIETIMRGISFEIIEPLISERFVKQTMPPKTIIPIHTRDQRDAVNIIKMFYAKYPQYRWISLRDMRGFTEEEFYNGMKDSLVSVWVDPISGFGTFPLESMKMGIPVIGLVPNLLPEWMNEDNGLWLNNPTLIVDVIADFLQNWLEDNVDEKLYVEMEKTANQYADKSKFEGQVLSVFDNILNVRLKSFKDQLNKLETIE